MGSKTCASAVEMAALTPHYSTEEIAAMNPNVDVISSNTVTMLLTKLGDEAEPITRAEYVSAADRLMTILAEECLARLPRVVETKVAAPHGEYSGLGTPTTELVCGVGSARSGGTLAGAVRKAASLRRTAEILVLDLRPDEDTGILKLLYSKLPASVADSRVVLCDPELATGGSACIAVGVLKDAGVKEENILLLSVVSCPEGLVKLSDEYPGVKIVTVGVDVGDGIPI